MIQFHRDCTSSWDVRPQFQPCVHAPRVLESSADRSSQNTLALYWNNANEKEKISSSSFFFLFFLRCWGPCCLFLICSTIFWGDAVLPSKCTELFPQMIPMGLCWPQSKLAENNVTEAVFHWKGPFRGEMFLGNVWCWVNLWLKNVRLL